MIDSTMASATLVILALSSAVLYGIAYFLKRNSSALAPSRSRRRTL